MGENFQEQYNAPRSKGATASVEAMRDPGFHIGKIDTQTLNAIEAFGLKIKNSKNEQGEGVVDLNPDKKFRVNLESSNGSFQDGGNAIITIDNGTKDLKVYALKQDGYPPRADAPLRIMSVNKDGTTDYITFIKNTSEVSGNQFDLNDIYSIDTITRKLDGTSSNEKFPKSDEALFKNAKQAGIHMEYDNSRSNGINISDKNGNYLGHVTVFMNGNWKTELTNILRNSTSGKNEATSENKEFLTAKNIDAQLTNGTIKPRDLVNNPFIQKSIIREWNNISDASVLKVKEYTIRLAKEAYPNDALARLSPQDISITNRLPVMKLGLPLQGKDGIVFDDNNPGFTVVSKKDPSKELLRLTIDK